MSTLTSSRPYVGAAAALIIAVTTLAPGAQAQPGEKQSDFHVIRGELYRKTTGFDLVAIETPGLLDVPFVYGDVVPTLHSLAAVGASGFVFDIDGLSEDGSSISEEALASLYEAVDAVEWRYLAGVCRVVPTDAPDDPAWRERAVKTVAKALADEREIMYLIDCPGAAELAKTFKSIAPRLCVIAPENGDMILVEGDAPANPKAPLVYLNKIDVPNQRTHYILPAGDASFAKVDEALANPIESQPWEPDFSVLPADRKADGWIPLFNGKNFDGWFIEGDPSCWTVEDGCIKWLKRGGQVIRSRNRYDNFQLHAEFVINEGGNSGIFVRAPRSARESKIGMESQIEGDHGKPVTKTSTGSIYDVVPPLKNMSKPAGEWNTLELTLDDDHFLSFINGEKVQDTDLSANPELKHRLKKGFIGLQDHGNPVLFRNIWIKPL